MYKKHGKAPMWIPPAQVKGFRAAGWKTQKECEEAHAKWLRKHPKAARVRCPLCSGTGRVWKTCCEGGDCLCKGLPEIEDCCICKGVGGLPREQHIDIGDLVRRLDEQNAINDWVALNAPLGV